MTSYAVAIAVQLRYFHEFEERARTYERSYGVLPLNGLEASAFLAMPSENADALRNALRFLKSHELVSTCRVEQLSRLAVARVAVPTCVPARVSGRASSPRRW